MPELIDANHPHLRTSEQCSIRHPAWQSHSPTGRQAGPFLPRARKRAKGGDSPVLALLMRRLRNPRKRLRNAEEIKARLLAGRRLNADQVGLEGMAEALLVDWGMWAGRGANGLLCQQSTAVRCGTHRLPQAWHITFLSINEPASQQASQQASKPASQQASRACCWPCPTLPPLLGCTAGDGGV